MDGVETYHSVLSPVSSAFWYSGRVGTTVGNGVCFVLATSMTVAKASTGSTIMMAVLHGCEVGGNFASFTQRVLVAGCGGQEGEW